MLINWFTVGAQALNFIILVWLMKRFLFKPIRKAIDEREKRIATEIATAHNKKADAENEVAEFKRKNDEFDTQRATLFSKVNDEVQAERKRLLDEAREAAAALNSKREETLRNEKHRLFEVISRRTQREVFAIVRKTLSDLAMTSLEERLVEVFISRLREVEDETKTALAGALKTSVDPAVVRSAFDLTPAQNETIKNAVNETFQDEIQLRFVTAPDLVSGIELTANGQKVAWSIADYLASMEKSVDELLKERTKSVDKAASIPQEAQAKTVSQ